MTVPAALFDQGPGVSLVPSGVGVFAIVFSPQYREHGGALRKPAGGDGVGVDEAGRLVETDHCLAPADSEDGTLSAVVLDRIVWPW